VYRGGKWFLIATIDLTEPEVFEPNGWIGVDRGIVNLATTSDGDNHQGRRLGRYRRRHARKRAEIQAKRTPSAAKLLKKRARREARHTVVGAGSLARPTTSPESTCALVHAGVGIRQHARSRPRIGTGRCDPGTAASRAGERKRSPAQRKRQSARSVSAAGAGRGGPVRRGTGRRRPGSRRR
jgi:hypothetical protein